MKIAVMVKVLPDDQDIVATDDGQLDFSRAKNTISTYDLNAIEAAAQLAEAEGAELVAVVAGPKRVDDSKTRKNILSRGVDSLCILADDSLDLADSRQTGRMLAKIVEKVGDVDLVVCGDGSADLYAQQVDVQLAEALGWVNTNAVVSLKADGAAVSVERVLEDEKEVVKMPLPAVVAVSPDIALPRIAGMKDILAAGKKPVVTYSLEDAGGLEDATVETLEIKAPQPTARKKMLFDGSSDEGIDEFVKALKEAM
ncbi:MAG TPA: putative electron transfer flavoprotein FixA [Candidatus Rubneribacter avistercoris]|nr:putative electron transfer flavoprotein FixA [Candidatus Rubneribacter avistercoris]